MAQDNRTIDERYDEQLRSQQDRLTQTYSSNTRMYGDMRVAADKAYEAMRTEAHINKALADLAGGLPYSSITHRQRGESALRNEIGDTERQRQDFSREVDLALSHLATQYAADQASTAALNIARRNAEKISQRKFDAELGLQKQYYELDKSNSTFDQMYKLYLKRLVDKDTFKAMTGIEVKAMPKTKKIVKKYPPVGGLLSELSAPNAANFSKMEHASTNPGTNNAVSVADFSKIDHAANTSGKASSVADFSRQDHATTKSSVVSSSGNITGKNASQAQSAESYYLNDLTTHQDYYEKKYGKFNVAVAIDYLTIKDAFSPYTVLGTFDPITNLDDMVNHADEYINQNGMDQFVQDFQSAYTAAGNQIVEIMASEQTQGLSVDLLRSIPELEGLEFVYSDTWQDKIRQLKNQVPVDTDTTNLLDTLRHSALAAQMPSYYKMPSELTNESLATFLYDWWGYYKPDSWLVKDQMKLSDQQEAEDYVARRMRIEASELENYDFEKRQTEIDDLQNQLDVQNDIISKINAIDRVPYDPNQNAASDAYAGDDYIGRLENHKNPYANMSDAQCEALLNNALQQKRYLENTIAQKQQRYGSADMLKKYKGIMSDYTGMFENPDFEEYATKGAAIENDTEGWGLELFGWTPFQSINNKVKFGRENYFELVFGAANSTESTHAKYAKYYFMADDEVKLYNYLLAKDNENGTKKAETFLNQIDFVLNARQMGQHIEGWKRVAEQHPVAASLVSVPISMLSGAGYIKAGVTHLFGEEIDPNDPVFGASRGVSAIRGQVSSDIYDVVGGGIGGKLASFGYQTGMSIAVWAATAALTGGFGNATGIAAKIGEAGMLTIMGTNAATAAALDAFDRGATQDQAVTAGFWAGAAEVVFEKISLDHFIKIKAPASRVAYVANALKQAGIEGSEELATELSNIITDIAIMGDKSNYSLAVKNYMAQGMPEAEAKKAAAGDMAWQVGQAFIGGFFSGGTIGSGAGAIRATVSQAQTRAANIQTQQDANELIIDMLQNRSSLDNTVEQFAQKLAELNQNSRASTEVVDAVTGFVNALLDMGDAIPANVQEAIMAAYRTLEASGVNGDAVALLTTANQNITDAITIRLVSGKDVTGLVALQEKLTELVGEIGKKSFTVDTSMISPDAGDLFSEYFDTIGADEMPPLAEFERMYREGGKAWTELTLKKSWKEALRSGTVGPFTRFEEYKAIVGVDGQGGIAKASEAMIGLNQISGGAYKNVPASGGQVHHMPADSVSPYSKNNGPAIRMETRDHMDTANWGSSKKAIFYRAKQKALIEQGKFLEAQKMDIDEVRYQFGDKYDYGIKQMLAYTIELIEKNKME